MRCKKTLLMYIINSTRSIVISFTNFFSATPEKAISTTTTTTTTKTTTNNY